MCFFLNVGMALKATIAATVLAMVVTILLPDLSAGMAFVALMDVPAAVLAGRKAIVMLCWISSDSFPRSD